MRVGAWWWALLLCGTAAALTAAAAPRPVAADDAAAAADVIADPDTDTGTARLAVAHARAAERRRRRLGTADPAVPVASAGNAAPLALPGPAFGDVSLRPPHGCSDADATARVHAHVHSAPDVKAQPNEKDEENHGGTSGLSVCGRRVYACEHMAWAGGADDKTLPHTTRTAARVWDGAIALARVFDAAQRDTHHPLHGWLHWQRVLELGSGQTGVAGLAAAACGAAHVTVSDTVEALPALRANVQLNAALTAAATGFASPPWPVSARAIDWSQCDGPRDAPCSTACVDALPAAVDVLVSADVVWVDALIHPLVRTAYCALTTRASAAVEPHEDSAHPQRPVWVMAYQSRSRRADAHLHATLQQYGLTARTVQARVDGSAVDILAIAWADGQQPAPRASAHVSAAAGSGSAGVRSDDTFASVMRRARRFQIDDLWGGHWLFALLRVVLVILIVAYVRVNMWQ